MNEGRDMKHANFDFGMYPGHAAAASPVMLENLVSRLSRASGFIALAMGVVGLFSLLVF
jgi:hypothetical protein